MQVRQGLAASPLATLPTAVLRLVTLAVAALLLVLLAAGYVLLREADARSVWHRCNEAGFPFAQTERELNRMSWLNRVQCEGGRCRWKTWLNAWACQVADDDGVARQGGSG